MDTSLFTSSLRENQIFWHKPNQQLEGLDGKMTIVAKAVYSYQCNLKGITESWLVDSVSFLVMLLTPLTPTILPPPFQRIP